MWDAIEEAPGLAEEGEEAVEDLRGKKYRFSIGVSARFRPFVAGAGGADGQGEQVVLPLHQRVKLVQGAHGNCSRAEAMRLLMEERHGATKSDPWASADCAIADKVADE